MALIKWIYLVFRAILSALAIVPIALWRLKWLRYAFLLILIAGGAATYIFYGQLPQPVEVYDVVWLDQGWTEDQRQKYYQTNQGTLIIPYDWFLALEMPPTLFFFESLKPFRSNDNASRYRLIPDPRPKYNPDTLPVGLTKVSLPDDIIDLGLGHRDWLSFSCAACHTGQLTYKGLGIRIDGMPAMWDFSQYGTNLTGALLSTYLLPTKFDRFAAKVLGSKNTPAERDKLRKAVKTYQEWPLISDALKSITSHTYPTREGPGRTDALGRGANGQFSVLNEKVNVRVGDAPVSFPPLWYTHDYDWVQSTTGIQQPLGRNVTEAWGVNAIVDVMNTDPSKLFRSTHPIDHLFWMETLISVLEHPRWPSEIFGPINETLAEQGRVLYEESIWVNPRDPRSEMYCGSAGEPMCNEERIKNQKGYCARCHSPVLSGPPCEPEKAPGCSHPPFQLTLYRLDVMGTDPKDAKNFNERVGTLSPGTGAFREEFKKTVKPDDLSKPNLGFGIGNGLQFTTQRVMDWWFRRNQPQMEKWVADGVFPNLEQGRKIMEGFRPNNFRAPLGYPARPSAGSGAAAPPRHNHSIRDMYELLSPLSERSTSFWIGNTEFDPVRLGFESTRFRRGFQFDSSKAGNSIAGHEFSAQPGDPAKPGVIGPALTVEQRMAILEYMKKVDDVPKLPPHELARRRTLLKKMQPYYEGVVSETYKSQRANYPAEQAPTPVPPPAPGRK